MNKLTGIFVFTEVFFFSFFLSPDLTSYRHKICPGHRTKRKIYSNKCDSQQQSVKRTVGFAVISIFHQCTIQADHRKLTVEVSRLGQNPASLPASHPEETQRCFRMERGRGAARQSAPWLSVQACNFLPHTKSRKIPHLSPSVQTVRCF